MSDKYLVTTRGIRLTEGVEVIDEIARNLGEATGFDAQFVEMGKGHWGVVVCLATVMGNEHDLDAELEPFNAKWPNYRASYVFVL